MQCGLVSTLPGHLTQEVFPTRTDLAVVIEYASGGDMSQLIEDTLRATVRLRKSTCCCSLPICAVRTSALMPQEIQCAVFGVRVLAVTTQRCRCR